jgi:adenylate cyclase
MSQIGTALESQYFMGRVHSGWGLSKEYGTHIVIGEATRGQPGSAFAYRELDKVAVKGREEPLVVYEVVSPVSQLGSNRARVLERYQRGLELYRSRRWNEAQGLFGELHAEAPDDGPTAL